MLAKYLRVPLDEQRAMIEEGYETYREILLEKPYAAADRMKLLLEIIAESNPKPTSAMLPATNPAMRATRHSREFHPMVPYCSLRP